MEECVTVMEEMIELNPNDNQGTRNTLMLYLIELDENEKFEKYSKIFEGEESAFYLFNLALFAFKTKGEGVYANRKLSLALKQNKFVATKLISPKSGEKLPDTYGFGDTNEASYYSIFSLQVWQ